MPKILFGLLCALSFSCGIKGPPLPPVREETVQAQKANETKAPTAAEKAESDATKKKENK